MSSVCCGAPLYPETDICSQCKEHSSNSEVYCPSCEWEGEEKEIEFDGEFTQEDGFVGRAMCPNCGKEGLEDID